MGFPVRPLRQLSSFGLRAFLFLMILMTVHDILRFREGQDVNGPVFLRPQSLPSYNDVINTTQTTRRQRLWNYCQVALQSQTYMMIHASLRRSVSQILVDENHKALYCYVPKAGCSFWKYQLMSLNSTNRTVKGFVHDPDELRRSGIRELKSYTDEEIIHRLTTYYKFMFVRHPLIRLVSAFRDKFTGPLDIYFVYLPQILAVTRGLNKPMSLETARSQNLTFTEFLTFLYSSAPTRFQNNEHWESMDNLCSPCLIKYDYIGKIETFNEDTNYLMSALFKGNISQYNTTGYTGTDETIAKKYFQSLPLDLREKVKKKYKTDAEMLGYSFQGF